MMTHNCDRCRFGSGGAACYASARPRLCVLIHDHGRTDYAALVESLTLNADPLAGPGKPIPAPPPERRDHLAWRALVLACDYRGADAEPCGCARLHYCLMGKGRKAEGMSIGAVSLADCHACVTSTDPTPTTQ
jgi:hypothetical protein